MPLEELTRIMIPAIEAELRQVVLQVNGDGLEEMHAMLAYHLGWEGEGAGPEASGKRIRPLLVLLTASAAGSDWEKALPAAAGVELVHNFSLIHDDIEDNSPLRRGRPTVWTKWGVSQAINAGDAMFTLAHLALLRLETTTNLQTALRATRLMQETCLQLTQGQYLDISYENRGDLTLDSYWPMVRGKTAALLSACTEIGAVVAGGNPETCKAYGDFGRFLGLAFQAQDDLLGIWGDAALTGKSSESDLVSGKKSLPVLYGLGQNGPFAARWRQGPIPESEVKDLAALLEAEGGFTFTQETAKQLTDQSLEALENAKPQGKCGEALKALALRLLGRQG
jgi:geranylgeranyl diphosphate synthase type I